VKSWKNRTVQLTLSTALSQPVKFMGVAMLRKLQYTTSLGRTIPRSGRLPLPGLQPHPPRYGRSQVTGVRWQDWNHCCIKLCSLIFVLIVLHTAISSEIGSRNRQQKSAAKIGSKNRIPRAPQLRLSSEPDLDGLF